MGNIFCYVDKDISAKTSAWSLSNSSDPWVLSSIPYILSKGWEIAIVQWDPTIMMTALTFIWSMKFSWYSLSWFQRTPQLTKVSGGKGVHHQHQGIWQRLKVGEAPPNYCWNVPKGQTKHHSALKMYWAMPCLWGDTFLAQGIMNSWILKVRSPRLVRAFLPLQQVLN